MVYGKLLLANEIGAVEVEAMAKKGVTDIANFFKQVPQAHVCLQKLIVNKHLPIDLVEDADFRGFAEGLSKRYKPQSKENFEDSLRLLVIKKRSGMICSVNIYYAILCYS